MSQDFIEDLMWKISKVILNKIKNVFKKKRNERNIDSSPETLALNDTNAENEQNSIKENKENDYVQEAIIDNIKANSLDCTDAENILNNIKETTLEQSEVTSENITETAPREEIVENQLNDSVNRNDSQCWWEKLLENNEIFFHFTIFLLWSIVAIINIPVVLTWAHDYK